MVIDTVARSRREITRTTGNESSPRWARGGSHVTFVRDNNLFIVPVEGTSAGTLVQLTDVSSRRADPRATDSQRVLKEEEQKLLDWVEQEAARRKRREARERALALPKFELGERQSVADAALLYRCWCNARGLIAVGCRGKFWWNWSTQRTWLAGRRNGGG